MNNLIFQYWNGPRFKDLVDLSKKSVSDYASRIGVGYRFFDSPMTDYRLPHHQFLWMFDEKQNEYDDILYLDADIMVNKHCSKNVFDFPGHGRNLPPWDGYGFEGWHGAWKRWCDQHGKLDYYFPDAPGINGGFYKFSREDRQYLRESIRRWAADVDVMGVPGHFNDEVSIHCAIGASGFKFKLVDTAWNSEVSSCYEPQATNNFYHICPVQKYGGQGENNVENAIEKLRQMDLI